MSDDSYRRRVPHSLDRTPLLPTNSGHVTATARGPQPFVTQNVLALVIGMALLAAAVALQVWNEEGCSLAVSLRPSSSFVNGASATASATASASASAGDGLLVHLVDTVHVPDVLEDRQHGVSVAAVKLKRRVQTYQWLEEQTVSTVYSDSRAEIESSLGESELQYSYHYYTAWRDSLVDSSTFRHPLQHENPKQHALSSWVRQANVSLLGVYRVSDQLRQLFQHYTVFAGDERPPAGANIKLHGAVYYHTHDWRRIEAPHVGDTRVQFAYAGKSGDTYSVVAMLSGGQLLPYVTSFGHQLLLLQPGRHTAEELFHRHHVTSWQLLWLFRAVGLALGAVAVCCLRSSNISLPEVANIWLVLPDSSALALSVCLSLLCIGCSWLIYRPLLALCSLLLIALTLYLTSPTPGVHEQSGGRRYTVMRPARAASNPLRHRAPPAGA